MNNEKAINVIIALFIVGFVVFALDTCFHSTPVMPTTTNVTSMGAGGYVGDSGLGGAGGMGGQGGNVCGN